MLGIIRTLIAIVLLMSAGPVAAAMDRSEARALEVLEKIDDLWRADSSRSTVSMKVVTAHYTRNVRMENWTLGKEKSLVRIISPRKEKGAPTAW